MLRLWPVDNRYYDDFDQVASLLVSAAKQLQACFKSTQDPTPFANAIKRIEREADTVTYANLERLYKAFFTPFDRTDIRALIKALDDVIDFIDAAVSRVALYEVREVVPAARTLSRVLVDASREVAAAVGAIRKPRNHLAIMTHCQAANALEGEGDRILRTALAELFRTSADPLLVIKWKEILEHIEAAIDCCQAVANIVEAIVVRRS